VITESQSEKWLKYEEPVLRVILKLLESFVVHPRFAQVRVIDVRCERQHLRTVSVGESSIESVEVQFTNASNK